MKTISTLPVALALAFVLPASHGAPEDALLSRLRREHPKTTFDAVRRSAIPGLYEVRMGDNVAYVSASRTRYFLFGHLYDADAGVDLTKGRQQAAPAPVEPPAHIDFDALPLADAIKTVSGNGAAQLAVFTDPACPYCQRLEGELAKLPDATVYKFLVPFLGDALPQTVWCAKDRQRAWEAAMHGQLAASEAPACANPIERNRQLATRLGIVGTPTLVLSTGGRIDGYASAHEIARQLAVTHATTHVTKPANTKE